MIGGDTGAPFPVATRPVKAQPQDAAAAAHGPDMPCQPSRWCEIPVLVSLSLPVRTQWPTWPMAMHDLKPDEMLQDHVALYN